MTCIDGNWRTAAAALSMLLATGGSVMAGSLGGPLELQDEGSFFVNGQLTQSTHPGTAVGGISQPGTITVNQMYAHRARAESNAALLPDIQIAPRERAWYFFRIGATYPTPYPGSQFPVEAFDQYTAQLVPNAEATLPGAGANTVRALDALLDKIGPAVVMVHSQSGAYGMDLVRARAAKMLGFINVEGNCAPVTPDEIANTFSKIPLLSIWGDNSQGAPGPNGDERRNGCAATVNAIKSAGGSAKFLLLPEAGHKGNSHMLMMDKNNLAIADLIIGWLGESVAMR
jgi:pimeloyl-ACP methyl ester carboxylesterase